MWGRSRGCIGRLSGQWWIGRARARVVLGTFLRCCSLEMLFIVVRDIHGQRPTETILLTYGRMLSPRDRRSLKEIGKYRNEVVNVEKVRRLRGLTFLEEWKVGEL